MLSLSIKLIVVQKEGNTYGGPQVQRRNKKSRQNTFQLLPTW